MSCPQTEPAIVRVADPDVLAANGPRAPTALESQMLFNLSLYLVDLPVREPVPDALARAASVASALADHFRVATGGRMLLQPPPHR